MESEEEQEHYRRESPRVGPVSAEESPVRRQSAEALGVSLSTIDRRPVDPLRCHKCRGNARC